MVFRVQIAQPAAAKYYASKYYAANYIDAMQAIAVFIVRYWNSSVLDRAKCTNQLIRPQGVF